MCDDMIIIVFIKLYYMLACYFTIFNIISIFDTSTTITSVMINVPIINTVEGSDPSLFRLLLHCTAVSIGIVQYNTVQYMTNYCESK